MKLVFENSKTLWFKELKEKVDAYFTQNKIRKTGNWKLYIKTIFWLLMLVGTYLVLILNPNMSVIFGILFCGLQGLTWAGIGFNIVHDAAHGSYSSRENTNSVMSRFFDVMAASSFMWRTKHNIVHHTYTNIEGVDDDIDAGALLRLAPQQKWRWYHRLQASYALVLYAFIYILWISQKDIEKYVSGKIGSISITKMSAKEKILFWLFKFLYLIIYIFIPIIIFKWSAIWGYLIAAGVCGITISIVFQLAHVVTKAKYPTPTDDFKMAEDFHTHQVITTADFATNSKIVSWLLGGLNFQVMHHLFPKISHVHYPAIQKIAKEVFEKYGIEYNEYKTLLGAFIDHIRQLNRLGLKPS